MKRKLLANDKAARRVPKKGNFLDPLVAHMKFFAQDLSHVGYFHQQTLTVAHDVDNLGGPPQIQDDVNKFLHCLHNGVMLLQLPVSLSFHLVRKALVRPVLLHNIPHQPLGDSKFNGDFCVALFRNSHAVDNCRDGVTGNFAICLRLP